MTQVQSFAPVIGEHPRILILGSMPGVASLEAVQYYAHPRNAFWPIMGELFGIDPATDYAQRIAQISRQPVVLWDTLQVYHDLSERRYVVSGLDNGRNPPRFREGGDPREFNPNALLYYVR